MARPVSALFAMLAVLVIAVLAAPASAAELVMLRRDGCIWCARFEEEIARAYPKTREGCLAPLRRVDINAPIPADLAGIVHDRITPTFVLMDDGKEFGRIRGYPGDAFFWSMLDELLTPLTTKNVKENGCGA